MAAVPRPPVILFETGMLPLDVARMCQSAIDRSIAHLSVSRGTGAPRPMGGAGVAYIELCALVRAEFPAWFALTLSQDGRRSLVDIAFVALCYLLCVATPKMMVRAHVEVVSRESVLSLQKRMRQCQREWGKDVDTCAKWAHQLDEIRHDVALAVVAGLSHFDASDASMVAPDVGATTNRYADIDMHASTENRAQVIEDKERMGTATVPSGSSSSGQADEKGVSPQLTVDAERFVTLATRTFMSVDEHMRVLASHTVQPKWTGGSALSDAHLTELLRFEITSASSKALEELYVLRYMPIGARLAALRYSHGQWSTISAPALAREELSTDECQKIGVIGEITPKNTFKTLKTTGWGGIHDAWVLILWERMVKTDLGVSFLEGSVVQSHELLEHAQRWSDRRRQARNRDPVLVEACGQWFVSSVNHLNNSELLLVPCGGLMCGIQAWANAMRSQPRGCVSVTGHQWAGVIDAVLGKQD